MRLRWVVLLFLFYAGRSRRGSPRSAGSFDHWQHRKLFPNCASCHAGVLESGRPLWPAATACADCHDGIIEEPVEWRPPSGPPPTNLRFTHGGHAEAVRTALAKDSR